MVGNGEKINIREDKWLPRGLIGGPANRDDPTLVSELLVREEAKWKEQKLSELFDCETTREILAIFLNPQLLADKLAWTPTKAGIFTVKSAYNRLREKTITSNQNRASSSFQAPKVLWNKIWQANT